MIAKTDAQELNGNFIAALSELENLNQQIAVLKEKEMTLRKEIFAACFDDPKEGTNTFKLLNGYVVKFNHKIDRKLDMASLPTVRELLAEAGVNQDDLIRMKPELSVTAYKKLPDEHRRIMDMAVTSKPGAPSYEIVLPKRGV